jgi:hypothetical protein
LVTVQIPKTRAADGAAVTRATIPDDVRAHAFGPRRTATVAYLSGSPHVSKRGIEELVETLFGVAIGPGTVCNLEQEIGSEGDEAAQLPADFGHEAGGRRPTPPRSDRPGIGLAPGGTVDL